MHATTEADVQVLRIDLEEREMPVEALALR
jgi:hypothetical protein